MNPLGLGFVLTEGWFARDGFGGYEWGVNVVAALLFIVLMKIFWQMEMNQPA